MPLDEEDYRYLAEDGLDGLTVYQETYDEKDMQRYIYRVKKKF